jgi:hypothetical protein
MEKRGGETGKHFPLGNVAQQVGIFYEDGSDLRERREK